MSPGSSTESYPAPRRRWEDNIKMDLREVGYDDRDWINLAQDRDQWRAYCELIDLRCDRDMRAKYDSRSSLMQFYDGFPRGRFPNLHKLCEEVFNRCCASGGILQVELVEQVESQIKDVPLDHGIKVRPSGRLPSARLIPGGSKRDGMPQEFRDLLMISLSDRREIRTHDQRPARKQIARSTEEWRAAKRGKGQRGERVERVRAHLVLVERRGLWLFLDQSKEASLVYRSSTRVCVRNCVSIRRPEFECSGPQLEGPEFECSGPQLEGPEFEYSELSLKVSPILDLFLQF
ncbi:hypothetical protein ANN_22951 [Periplaneta americana]|uniref:Uncharacterized protein n=1 Tax=Periplaneta americana TaxID=6978 RepID=A0ABQ8SKZ6_PERAM|nr:hypothetical protein ANN_22951 [Periplaneta americana]